MLPLKVYWLCGFPLLKKWDWGVEVLNMARVFFFFFLVQRRVKPRTWLEFELLSISSDILSKYK